MGGIILLFAFLFCGLVLMDSLIPQKNILIRIWLGLCAGLLLMMWTPTLFAFFIDFTKAAQLLGLSAAAFLSAACRFLNRKKARLNQFTDIPIGLLLALLIPLALLSGYLQYSHTLRNVDGALHVGQSTYGDLCLHLGIATSLRNASYPPDYNLLPGTTLGYPFLADSMVTSMLLMGSELSLSFIITGTLMMLLVFTGFIIFAWELTHSVAATAVAYTLMFINGGLGFLYSLDGVAKDSSLFREIFTGFYRAPTNIPDLNLRWVNVICDMMIPQRTLLAGWMSLIPALYMLICAIKERKYQWFILLGVWAGAMPMVHTHSFLGLGLISAGAMVYSLVSKQEQSRKRLLFQFLTYGGLAMLLALPQLITWSFPQTVNGGSLGLRFNWVNNQGDGTLIDGYCWFWIKNVGIIWLLMVPAALTGRRGGLRRMFGLGALCIYIIAEFIQFQPNPYDNNKLFYIAYMVMMHAMGRYLCQLWKKLSGLRGRALLAIVFIGVSTLSGSLSIAREVVSDYRLFSAAEVEAAQFIDENLPQNAVILTGQQHNNAVAALAGRDIVCGTPSYLYYHGIDYSRQQTDQKLMLETPAANASLFEAYNIDYIYISSYELTNYDVDIYWFSENCEEIFSNDEIVLYYIGKSPTA